MDRRRSRRTRVVVEADDERGSSRRSDEIVVETPTAESRTSRRSTATESRRRGGLRRRGRGRGRASPSVESPYDRPGRWYVVHTYSGYENKVRSNMGNVVASRGIEDRVFEVVIPMEDVVEFKGGKKVTVQKKVFPGYLLVRCDLDDDTWGAIRNTPGVTGFVGPGTKPTPLSRREVENILQVKVEGGRGGHPSAPGPASSTRSTRRSGSRKAPSPTSRARSPRSTRTSSSSRCWSTSSAGRPRSSSSSAKSPSSRPHGHRTKKEKNRRWHRRRRCSPW